jgi:hypothetical protein
MEMGEKIFEIAYKANAVEQRFTGNILATINEILRNSSYFI